MAKSDWHLIHTALEFWHPNPATYAWSWQGSTFFRWNEKAITLAEGPGDTYPCVYLFDKYSYTKLVDLHAWEGTLNNITSFVFFNNAMYLCGGYGVGGFPAQQRVITVVKIASDLNISKVVDTLTGTGGIIPLPEDPDHYTAASGQLSVINNSLRLIFSHQNPFGAVHPTHTIYGSPSGSAWWREMDNIIDPDGFMRSSKSYIIPTSQNSGLAGFDWQDIGMDLQFAGYQFSNGYWAEVAGTTTAEKYNRLFITYGPGIIHNDANDQDVEITNNWTNNTLFLPEPIYTGPTGLVIWQGTWWWSGPTFYAGTPTQVYWWHYPTKDWILDAGYNAGEPEAGEGFVLNNTLGVLWGVPEYGTVDGIYYRDKQGFGTGKSYGKSWKLSIDRDEERVYASTYTLSDTPEFWRISSDLNTVDLIEYSTISGAPGLIQSYYDDAVVLGGIFVDSILRYSTDTYTTGIEYIEIPSGVLYATALETQLNQPTLANMFVCTTPSPSGSNSIPMLFNASGHYDGGVLVAGTGIIYFEARGSTRNRDNDIFIGQATLDNMAKVQYTMDLGDNFEIRDTGLPDTIVTDLEFA